MSASEPHHQAGGFNIENVDYTGPNLVIHRVSVTDPAHCLQMLDTNDWQISDYPHPLISTWQENGETRDNEGGAAAVAYRHGDLESCNVQFFDGHVAGRHWTELNHTSRGGKLERHQKDQVWVPYND